MKYLMAYLTNLTLWKKITLLTVLGLLLGVGVFSTLGMGAVNRANETMLQDRLTTARLVADYIDEKMALAINELRNAARAIAADSSGSNIETQISTLEATYARLSIETYGFFLLDSSQEIIWFKPWVAGVDGSVMAGYETIIEAVETGQPTISGLVSAPVTNTPVVLLAYPTQNAAPARTLVAAIDPVQSSIGGFVQPIRLGKTGYVELVDQNGMVVARTRPGPKLSPFEKSDHSGRFSALIDAREPTRGVCHTCHEPEQKVQRKDVLAFVPLSEANWGVVIRQSEEEALAPAHELRQNLLLSGGVLVTIALLFVVITTQNIGRRIRTLTTASQRIAGGDLVTAVKPSGKDEVGVLAQTLDDMRAKLRYSYGELEQKTRELSSLLSVSEILTSTFELTALLDAVVAKTVEVIPGADAGILLVEGGHKGVLAQCTVGLDKALCQSALTRSAEVSPSSDEAKNGIKAAVSALVRSPALCDRIRSSIAGDVLHRNKLVGTLLILSLDDPFAFSPSDQGLLQAVAHYVAIAIERSQLAKEAGEARALHEADRLRSEFISSVSHELRTPLTFIKGYSTSLLREDVAWENESRREFLLIIDEKTDELLELIDKLLQSAKLEAGALKLEKEPVLIPRLAKKVIQERALRARKHRFTVTFPSNFPVVEADSRCIEQVIRNLVENAVKYSPEGGEIAVAGTTDDGKVVVSISDEGIGIPAQHQAKLFGRFYRVDSPLTRGTPGSGLGLSIARGHIEAHGGCIWLESEVGKGSKFYFSLPVEPLEYGREDGEEGDTAR